MLGITNRVITISLPRIHVLGITNEAITISLPRIHVLGIINALAVQIPRHKSKNTTNDLHKLSGNRNFTKRQEVKPNINHYKLVWLEKIANGKET